MATGTKFNVIYLGNFADLEAPAGTTGPFSDVDQPYYTSEANSALLLGTYDHNDLQVVEMTAYHRSSNSSIGNDSYPSSFYDNGQEGVEYSVVGGNTVGDGIVTTTSTSIGTPPPDYNNGTTGGIAIDNDVYYNAQVTFIDAGTGNLVTQSKIVAVFQTDNGDTFLQEYANSNSTLYNLDGLEITSITLTSVYSGDTDGVVYDSWSADGVAITVCFGRGTLIETADGPVAVEDLRKGIRVQTKDNGLQAIRWVNSRALDRQDLEHHPNMRPIRIRKGALGNRLPAQDLIVSPQHRVLVSSRIVERMFDDTEVLVAAKHLCNVDGIDIADDLEDVEYFHFLFDRHEIVVSNGSETESFYAGQQALRSVGPHARQEIFKLFPDLRISNVQPPAARKLVNGRWGRRLATRHMRNDVALVG